MNTSSVTKSAIFGLAALAVAGAAHRANAQAAQEPCPASPAAEAKFVVPFLQDGVVAATALKNSSSLNQSAITSILRDANFAGASIFGNSCAPYVPVPPQPTCQGTSQQLGSYALAQFRDAASDLKYYTQFSSTSDPEARGAATNIVARMNQVLGKLDACYQ